MVIYEVIYFDDFHQCHIAFVNSLKEINFIKERFDGIISYQAINKSFISINEY